MFLLQCGSKKYDKRLNTDSNTAVPLGTTCGPPGVRGPPFEIHCPNTDRLITRKPVERLRIMIMSQCFCRPRRLWSTIHQVPGKGEILRCAADLWSPTLINHETDMSGSIILAQVYRDDCKCKMKSVCTTDLFKY
jgi:hypothetical protein